MSRTFILRTNNADNLLINWEKNNCLISNQVTYFFFVPYELFHFFYVYEYTG